MSCLRQGMHLHILSSRPRMQEQTLPLPPCRYGEYFHNNCGIPMCAVVWSVPHTQAEQFPVQMLVRFWVNHHLLDVLQRPLWRVVKGRSESYVNAVLPCIHSVQTSTPVTSVTVKEGPGGVPCSPASTSASDLNAAQPQCLDPFRTLLSHPESATHVSLFAEVRHAARNY